MSWWSDHITKPVSKVTNNIFGDTIHGAVSDAWDTVSGAMSDAWDTLDKNFNDIIVDPLFNGSESAFWKSLLAVVAAPYTGGYSLAALPLIGGDKGIMGKGLSALGVGNAANNLLGALTGGGSMGNYVKLAGADRIAGGSSGGGVLGSLGKLLGGVTNLFGGPGEVNMGALFPLIGAGVASNTKQVPHLDGLYTALAKPVNRTGLNNDLAMTMLLGKRAGTDLWQSIHDGNQRLIDKGRGDRQMRLHGGLLGMALRDPLTIMRDSTTDFMKSQAYEDMQRALRATGGQNSAYAAKLMTDTMNDVALKRYEQQFNAMKSLYDMGNEGTKIGVNTGLSLGDLQNSINMANAGIYNTGRSVLGQGINDVFANMEANKYGKYIEPIMGAIMNKIGGLLG